MSYTLQGFVAAEEALRPLLSENLRLVPLGRSLHLIPLTRSARGVFGIPLLPFTDGGASVLPAVLLEIGERAGTMAYVEAELFGGRGTQAAAVWREGRLVYGPIVGGRAINHALRLLGVKPDGGRDEFETAGLDRCRDTEHWR